MAADAVIEATVIQPAGGNQRYTTALRLANRTQEVVLIDPFNVCSTEGIRANIFKIVDSDGKRVRYVGRVFKRGEPDFGKFIPLKPGEARDYKCRLDGYYDFTGTRGPYEITYATANMHPQRVYFRIESPPARFGW
jgi:hypothetical protein